MYGFFNVVTGFGAVGDGTTHCAVPFNNANSAAVAAGGGYIYVPPGRYFLEAAVFLGDTVLNDIPITLGGDGASLSVLVAGNLHSGGGAGAIMVANAQWATTAPAPVQTDIYIEKLGFDCDALDNNKKQGPIYFKQVLKCGVRDCEIFDSSTHGILILGDESPASWPGNNINFHILNNRINLNYQSSGTAGVFPIRVSGASNGLIMGNAIGDLNPPSTNTNDAIDFPGSSDVACCNNYVTSCADGMGSNACFDSLFANNRIVNSGAVAVSTFSTGGLGNNGVSNVVMSGNAIVASAKKGIRVSSPDTTEEGATVAMNFSVVGNVVESSSSSPGPAIHIEASQGCVTGNSIDLGGASEHAIGIDPSQTVASGQHGGNNIVCSGNGILDGGATSIGINFVAGTGETFEDCSVSNNNVDATIHNPIKLPTSLSTLNGCAIRDNTRINPYGTVSFPSAPSSPGMPVQNSLPFDVDVYVVNGSFTEIKINGQGTGLASGIFFLASSGTIEWDGPTGSTAPTWTWISR